MKPVFKVPLSLAEFVVLKPACMLATNYSYQTFPTKLDTMSTSLEVEGVKPLDSTPILSTCSTAGPKTLTPSTSPPHKLLKSAIHAPPSSNHTESIPIGYGVAVTSVTLISRFPKKVSGSSLARGSTPRIRDVFFTFCCPAFAGSHQYNPDFGSSRCCDQAETKVSLPQPYVLSSRRAKMGM